MSHNRSSYLESIQGSAVTLPGILQALPGCRSLYEGHYREIIDEVAPRLAIATPTKFAQIATAFADEEKRRRQFVEYMLTEHCGGVFIEKLLPLHAGHPAEALLRRHASDECLHGKLFGQLADTTVREHEGSAAHVLEQRYHDAYERWVGDDFFALVCLLHGFELRSAIVQCYWYTLMSIFPDTDIAALRPTFSRISTDEVFHITYTTRLVVDGLARGASGQILASALVLAEAPIEAVEQGFDAALATLRMA